MEEKDRIQDELELTQYLCKKQVEDLRNAQQEANTLQKAMVRQQIRDEGLVVLKFRARIAIRLSWS